MAEIDNSLWVKARGSDLLVPAQTGASSSVSATSNITLLQGKEQAKAIAQLYQDAGVTMDPTCDLAKHINAACEASDHWFTGGDRGRMKTDVLFRTIQMDHIATAILGARDAPGFSKHLPYLTRGTLDAFSREPSDAKDKLWELELYSLLRSKDLRVSLDEPDVVTQIDGQSVGFACKKIYSEKNISKTLSNGVAQIEGVSEYGVLAINLDDIGPPDRLRMVTSEEHLRFTLQQENISFLSRHERAFQRYLMPGRIMGAMVAIGGISYVMEHPTTARQFAVWVIPGLEPTKTRIMKTLEEAINRNWKV